MSKIGVLFPGQGSQFVGMGKALLERFPEARAYFEDASRILAMDLLSVCLEGPEEVLNRTDVCQPALYVASLAAAEALHRQGEPWLREIEGAAGLSLGEYTALVFAGALDFQEGLQLVVERGRAMQAAADQFPSGMASLLGATAEEAHRWCDELRAVGRLWVANLLCPGQVVVSGELAALQTLGELLRQHGSSVQVVRLAVAGAFHTPLMEPARERLEAQVRRVSFRRPRMPVYSNVDGAPHCEPDDFGPLLLRQLTNPVLWEASIRSMVADGIERFVEIGPKRVLRNLLRRIDRNLVCENVEV
jgi:[acyl-carrier-protein] S-malonyltransferase